VVPLLKALHLLCQHFVTTFIVFSGTFEVGSSG
jgi:hypothetical protein